MLSSIFSAILLGTGLSLAAPLNPRAVVLDQAATAEAQQRDGTATRAFTATQIKTADGSCLFIDPLSGDFRENLTPVQVKPCDGSKNQQFDVITAGKHINIPGSALIVSSLTNACLNFDPRRAAGNQVLLFSCGGRADGGGAATDSQAFAFNGQKTLALVPGNSKNAVCLTVKGGVVDQTACNPATASGNELFTIDAASGNAATPVAPATTAPAASQPTPAPAPATPTTPTQTAPISVSRAGGRLDPTAVAEAQQKDTTATRALTSVSVKTSDGKCLDIDPNAGDFRQNLIPVAIKACDNSPNQKFDVITKGKHNDQAGAALIVSSLTNGCLNFDPRRPAGDQVILFSCGGRADGEGLVTDSQLFNFTGGKGPLAFVPKSSQDKVCLVPKGGKLDQEACTAASASGAQLFSFA